MKKLTMGLLLCCFALQGMAAEKLEWVTDLPEAQAKAKAENKLVVMDFTGSDWCFWCRRLNQKIFSTPEFAEYAVKNLVLVEVDFPEHKPQSPELKKANQSLAEKYKIQGYPTVIVLDGDGRKVGRLGYLLGGPRSFIAELAKMKK